MDSSLDLISDLPDELLGKILSFLPTKVAASTSVLSKRWRRDLLVLVDTLCFDDSMIVYPNNKEAINVSHRFSDFVDKTLALLTNSPIKKFSLCVSRPQRSYDVNRWIQTAMKHPLLELHLHSWSSVCLETKVFTSNTLVKLAISGEFDLEAERVFFPALKSLSLLSIQIDHYNYSRLIDGCPVLEELYIRDDGDNFYPRQGLGTDLRSASIKRLVVFTNLFNQKDADHDQRIVDFQAPSLVYLDYSSSVFKKYEVVDLGLLVEARLTLKLWVSTNDYDDDDGSFYHVDEPNPPIYGDVTNLVAGISNIMTPHLSADSLEAFYFCCKSMPLFKNLLNLSIESDKEKGWQVMPLLLKSCPNLQTVVIKGLVHRVTKRCGDACACIPENLWPKKKKRKIVKEDPCCLSTCQVKVLEISKYGGSFQEEEQMRHFLGKLECLETVKVGVEADNDISKCLQGYVMALPRLSSKCNIQFF